MSRFYIGHRAVEVAFDDENLVANAGLALVGALCTRIGLAGIISDKVRLHGRVGGANPAYKSLSLICAMVARASHIDHLDMLRSGATGAILPFSVAAPSTVGTYLRSFTSGHLRQLDSVIEAELNRAWGLGMAPARDQPLVIDIDSTITEVSGYQKQGAAYGYTRKLGYHPLLAVRAETGEILGIRMRKGSA
ncbi:MAG: transposase, partial [Actinomycetota bacterium]|nr:transposase [Actinomycetota bacterium]